MRVLHVSSGNMFGGIEATLVTRARYHALCPEMEPHFALAFEGRVSRELRDTGAAVHVLGRVRASRPWTVVRVRRALASLLREISFDVVICHAPWPHAIFAPVVKAAGVPLVFWAHAHYAGRHWTERWASLTTPDFVICNSRFTSEGTRRLYPSTPHAIGLYPVARPSLDRSNVDVSAVRRELATPADAKVVLQVSRLEPWKGHAVLLDALAALAHRSDWICWMVGYPQTPSEHRYRQSLLDRASALGIADRVRFHVTKESIAGGRLYAAADVFCQTNIEPEPFGVVFIEAMLSQLPIVTSAIGGPLEFVDESNGILTPPSEATPVAAALERLFDDGDLRTRLGRHGRDRARELTAPEIQIPKLADTLADVIAAYRVTGGASGRSLQRSQEAVIKHGL